METELWLEVAVIGVNCPWCEAELEQVVAAPEQTCPDCLTTWSYEDEELALPLAA